LSRLVKLEAVKQAGEECLLVIATTTPIATTLAYFVPFEPSELGVPSATNTIDLGRDKMTVVM
jgi:hypothetical protein